MRIARASALCFVATLTACAGLQIPGTTTGGSTGGPSSGDVAADVVRYTNDARAANGVAPLATNARLIEAARLHANQMASYRRLEHEIPQAQYPTMVSRLEAVGYRYANVAENIAWNVSGARQVVNGWMNSSSHRANILDTRLTEMGAAMARSSNGETYWVQVFGQPR